MRVFVTGATGFIGSAVVKELLGAGHQVIGMTRTEAGAAQLTAAGATAHRGKLDDLASLRAGAAKADGVIHLAFMHAFSDAPLLNRLGVMAKGLMGRGLVPSFLSMLMATETAAIDALSASLVGTGGPMVVTVGTLGLSPGRRVTEADAPDPTAAGAARSVPAENAVAALATRGVRAMVMRLPPSVHGDGDGGFVPGLYGIAKKKGVSAYVGDGTNRWPAGHRLDVARLYRLVLEKGVAGGKYHGVGDEGVPFHEIAEVIGRRLNVPVVSKTPKEAAGHFSFLSSFVAADNPTSSALTQERMDWHPTGPSLIADIDRATYFKQV